MEIDFAEIGEPGIPDNRKKTRGRPSSRGAGSENSRTVTGGTGTGGAGTGTTKEEKEPVGLPVIDDEQKKRDERNAKRRAAYAAKKNAPKKVNKKNNVVDDKNIKDILTTVSMLISSRPDMAHWMLTPDEVDKLATPIANMISKSEFMSTAAEHSDAIALTTACFTILMPRVVITSINIKKNKKNKEVVKNAGISKQSELSDTGRTNKTGQDKTPNSGNSGNAARAGEDAGNNELYIGMPIG